LPLRMSRRHSRILFPRKGKNRSSVPHFKALLFP